MGIAATMTLIAYDSFSHQALFLLISFCRYSFRSSLFTAMMHLHLPFGNEIQKLWKMEEFLEWNPKKQPLR